MGLDPTGRDLLQEMEADYRILDVAGSHRDIGVSLGRHIALRKIERWGHEEPSQAFAEGCARVMESFHPGLVAEYSGYAEAYGVSMADLLPHISLNMPNGEAGGCSAIVCRAADGRILVGRNYDFFYRQRMRYVIRSAPSGYYASIGSNSGLLGGRYEGVNENGLFVSMHSIMAKRAPSVQPGVAFQLMVRIALETCSSAREAVRLFSEMPHIDSFSYTIADGKEMYVVETYPEAVRVFEGTGHLVVTNHYRDPELRLLQGRRDLSNSLSRYARLDSLALAAQAGSRSLDWLAGVLRDHQAPLCGHRDGIATLWSAVADLSERRVRYSFGSPCRNPYQELPWPGEASRQ